MITKNLSNQTTNYKAKARFILLTLLLVLVYSTMLFSATIYIDPTTTSSSQDGSINKPFSSWDKVSFANGNTYLQKAGTTFYTKNGIGISDKSNITLGSYGDGEKAKIEATGTGNHVVNVNNSSNIIIKDLEVTSTGKWISAIIIQGNSSANNTINNTLLHGTEWGVRIITKSAGNKVLKSTIHNVGDDGIYVKDASTIEIGYSTIFDVNKKYLTNTDEKVSSGDGIQIASTNNMNFHIHNNIIDHSSTGNKFCIIAWGENYTGIIENNVLTGNKNATTSGIYLSPTTSTVTVRYNVMKDGNYGIYAYAKNLDAYYNRFSNNTIGIQVNKDYSLTSRNNVFYNNDKYAVTSSENTNVSLYNNIISMNSSSAKAIKTKGTLKSDNNVFNTQHSEFINDKASLSAWKDASGNDKNSLVGDPGFMNADAEDFHLRANSIAINKGKNVELARDYFGAAVPSAGAPDAGIHEYDGKSTTTATTSQPEGNQKSSSPVEMEKEMTVYPNPSINGKFAIAFGEMKDNMQVEVYDLTGRLVKNEQYTMTSEGTLDLSTQPDGAYLIRLDSGEETKTLKAIKNT